MFRQIFFTNVLCLLSAAASLFGQAAGGGGSQPEVDEILIEFDGVPGVSEQYVRSNIILREGQPFSQQLVDKSIRAIYGTNLFEFVEVDLDRTGDEVDVTFTVRPKYRIERIRFQGNDRIGDRRLERELEFEAGQFLNELLVDQAAEAIEELYLKRGFADVFIDYEVVRDRVRGVVEVVYRIDEGKKFRVSKVAFEGNEVISSWRLRQLMDTRKWWIFSFLTGKGYFDEAAFEEDLDEIRSFYRDQGYLDIAIDEENIAINNPKGKKLKITIPLVEGRRYSVGEIFFEDNTIYTDDELRGALSLRPGDVFSPEKIDEAVTELTDYYGARGYLDTRVRAERRPNLDTRAIDLNFTFSESERFLVESINLQGNTKTKSTVIIREIALAPGDVFDLVRMKASEQRLKNTGYFEREGVTLSPESTNIPGRRDLRIVVREGRTGNLTFGAGFSSLEQAVFFAEVTQGNFDLFNWRSGFQGDGQKFRLRLAIGSQSNEAVIAFEEPWLFEQRLALGFELFRTESEFNSTAFDEVRSGLEVYLRKRLFELVEGRIAYRYEQVDIQNVSPAAAPVIREQAGIRSVSQVGLNLLRDTRNDLIFPTRGSRVELRNTVAGGPFLGDTDYWKVEARGSRFFKVFDFLEQTVSVIGRIGHVMPYGDSDEVPFFDRFFLGGPETLRGFEFREVGPFDPVFEDPTGGNSYGFFSTEYTFKIAEPFRFALFYDWGFLEASEWDFNPENYNDNWGLGVRILVLGAPLRLDYGIPITSNDINDEGGQFHFSFGTRF